MVLASEAIFFVSKLLGLLTFFLVSAPPTEHAPDVDAPAVKDTTMGPSTTKVCNQNLLA